MKHIDIVTKDIGELERRMKLCQSVLVEKDVSKRLKTRLLEQYRELEYRHERAKIIHDLLAEAYSKYPIDFAKLENEMYLKR